MKPRPTSRRAASARAREKRSARSGRRAPADRHAVALAEATERLSHLQQATSALSAAIMPSEVGEIALDHGRDMFGASAGALFWPGGGTLSVLVAFGYPQEALGAWKAIHGAEAPMVLEALQVRRPILLESSEAVLVRYAGSPSPRGFGLEAVAAIPLAVEDRSLGVLVLAFAEPRQFGPEDEASLVVLAQQCAQALERARLYEAERGARARSERAAERLSRLQEATAALAAASGSADVAEAIFQVGLDALEASGASLSFPSGGALVQVAHTEGFMDGKGGGTRPARLDVPLREAYERQEPVWIESAADYARRYPGLVELGVRITEGAWAALPLATRDRTLGVLGVGFAKPRRFEPEDRAFVLAIAQQCAQAIDRARLYEEQRRLRAEAEESAEERERLVRELRRTLRERDESMALLDALFANAPVGLALLDPDMRIVRVNGALAEMNGIPPERHLGRIIWEVVPDLPIEEMARLFKEVITSREPVFDLEIVGQTPAAPGKNRTWLETWYPVVVGDRVIGVGALVREVTERKQSEEFQRQVLAIVGHDLRSPLLAITSSASLLRKARDLPEREAKALARIAHAASRMDGIIRAIADYTRVQVGRGIPLDLRPCDLGAICRGVIEEAEAGHPGRVVSCDCRSPEEGEWDADRVGQLIANLVGNALDYGREDRPVRVACHGEGDEVVLGVANEGPPIPASFVPQLFEPFRRGPEGPRTGKKGLGLGLFIARQIALAHGGSIEARSSEEAGTVFAVRLPRRPPSPPVRPR